VKSRFERYVNVTLKREVYERLKEMARLKGFSVPDLINYLLNTYNDFVKYWESQRSQVLGNPTEITGNSTGNPPSNSPSNITGNPNVTSMTSPSSTPSKLNKPPSNVTGGSPSKLNKQYTRDSSKSSKKRRLMDILEEEGVIFLSDVAQKLRNPEAFVRKARSEGAVVLEGNKDTAIVHPKFWEEFKSKWLGRVPYRVDDHKEMSRLPEWARKLAVFLYSEAMMYYEKGRGWVLIEGA